MNKNLFLLIFVFFGIRAFAGENEAEEIYQTAKPMIGQESPAASRQLGLGLMQEAADKGHTKAQSIVGFHFAQGDILPKDTAKSLIYLQKAATSGDVFASRNLRVLCETKGGGTAENRAAALEALIEAANTGSAAAAAQLGELYFFGGDGTPPVDYHLAKKFLQIAAEQSDLQSCNTLGVIYEQGLAGEPDKQKALTYFKKAANGGYAKAQASLGFAYAGGDGVESDLIKAYKWFTLSALQGEVTGKNALGDFMRGLSEVQHAEGNRLVVEFLQNHGKEIPDDLLQKGDQTPSLPKGGGG
jgi:TPR repeat protein